MLHPYVPYLGTFVGTFVGTFAPIAVEYWKHPWIGVNQAQLIHSGANGSQYHLTTGDYS